MLNIAEPLVNCDSSSVPKFTAGKHRLPYLLLQIFTMGFFLYYTAKIFSMGNPFPYTDEWHMLAGAIGPPGLDLSWLFQCATNHCIPGEKLLYVVLARIFNYDFRVFVFVNLSLAYLTTALLTASLYRIKNGTVDIGDLAIPFMMLNVGLSPFWWGGVFVMASSVALVIALLGASLMYFVLDTRTKVGAFLLCAPVLLMPFTGGVSGILFAVPISITLIAAFLVLNKRGQRPGSRLVICVSLASLAASLYMFAICPNADALPHIVNRVDRILLFLYHLPNAFFGVCAIKYHALTLLFTVALLGVGLYTAWSLLKRARRRECDLMVIGVFAGCLFGVSLCWLLIAVGRSAITDFRLGHQQHYGYLFVPLPIICWLTVSLYGRPVIRYVAGTIVLVVMLISFWVNLGWRNTFWIDQYAKVMEISTKMACGCSIRTIVDSHIRDFYYRDSPSIRQTVEHGLDLLATRKGTMYNSLKGACKCNRE